MRKSKYTQIGVVTRELLEQEAKALIKEHITLKRIPFNLVVEILERGRMVGFRQGLDKASESAGR